jgi:hypothetical protein
LKSLLEHRASRSAPALAAWSQRGRHRSIPISTNQTGCCEFFRGRRIHNLLTPRCLLQDASVIT